MIQVHFNRDFVLGFLSGTSISAIYDLILLSSHRLQGNPLAVTYTTVLATAKPSQSLLEQQSSINSLTDMANIKLVTLIKVSGSPKCLLDSDLTHLCILPY